MGDFQLFFFAHTITVTSISNRATHSSLFKIALAKGKQDVMAFFFLGCLIILLQYKHQHLFVSLQAPKASAPSPN